MIQATLRPFTSDERTELIDRIAVLLKTSPGALPGTLPYAAAHAFRAFIVGCATALGIVTLHLPTVWAWIIVGAFTVTGFMVSLSRAAIPISPLPCLLEQLRRDEIEETTVIAYGVAEARDVFSSEEDSPRGYFFDIGDNSVLFLWEEHFPLADENDPNVLALPSVFTMTRYPDGDEVFSVAPAGPNLTVSRTLQFADEDAMLALTDGTALFAASLETLEQDLPELVCALPAEQP